MVEAKRYRMLHVRSQNELQICVPMNAELEHSTAPPNTRNSTVGKTELLLTTVTDKTILQTS